MCVILDANACGDVFPDDTQTDDGREQTEASLQFLNAIEGQRTRLVSGGQLHEELCRGSNRFRVWFREAQRSGRAVLFRSDPVDALADKLRRAHVCESDDEHVIALAQVSGARLLYSNDRDLLVDFKNPALLGDPRGKILPTKDGSKYRRRRDRLLMERKLCPNR